MKLVIYSAVKAHAAVVAPAASAFIAAAAFRTLFVTAFDKAVEAGRAGSIVVKVALQAGIVAAGVALSAAVEAAVADQAAFLLRALAAVRTVGSGLNAAVLAHLAVFAIISHTVRAGAADFALGTVIADGVALAAVRTSHVLVQMALQTQMRSTLGAFSSTVITAAALFAKQFIHLADTAFNTVTFVIFCAVEAHAAVLAVVGIALAAAAANDTPDGTVNNIALSAVGTGHVLVQMALQAKVFGSLGAFPSAVIAPAALVTEHFIYTAGAALPAVVAVLLSAVYATQAVFAPLAGIFAYSAILTVMVIAAAVACSAVVAVRTQPLIITP